MAENARNAKPAWPYTPFKTVLNLLQRMEDGQAVPPQIDRSFLGGSEGQKTQTLAALKFFGLVEGPDNEVTAALHQLVNETNDRPRLIGQLLAKHYPDATRLGGLHATTKQLQDSFEGLTGDTLRKAMTFYLHAAKYAQHPVSKHFKVPHGQGATRGARRPKGANGNGNGKTPAAPIEQASQPKPPDDPKTRYLNMLMEKASASETLDVDLLDRIEKLLGQNA